MAQLTNPAYGAEPPALTEGDRAPQAIEVLHLRYFVAVAEAGSFTHAAERIFIAQPTLSQQIRRLEQIVGTPLLHRRREGLRLTTARGGLRGGSSLRRAAACWPSPGSLWPSSMRR